jgi:hypothetical protein
MFGARNKALSFPGRPFTKKWASSDMMRGENISDYRNKIWKCIMCRDAVDSRVPSLISRPNTIEEMIFQMVFIWIAIQKFHFINFSAT